MSNYATTAAYTAAQALIAQGLEVKRSHLSEISAALLGYRTYAALTADEADVSRLYHLEEAEILVLNLPLAEKRVAELKLASQSGFSSQVVSSCIDAIKASAEGVKVFVRVDEFYDLHGRQALADAVYNDEDVAGAMAESNASFPDEPYMADECPPTADLWSSADEWVIEADGVMEGEYDPEGDRMYNGDTLFCRGRLYFSKAGRAGLVFIDSSGSAGADDSWRQESVNDDQL